MMKIFKNKKAFEVNQQLVMAIFSIILIFVFFIFVLKSCSSLSEKQRSVILSDLEADIRAIVDLLSPRLGSVQNHQFEVPAGTEQVCFVDLNHSREIIENTALALEYPIINQSLAAGNQKNIFLISNYQVTDSLYGGNICFPNYPFYSCIATRGNILDVWFQGQAGCTTLYINWSMFPENFRNETLYNNSPLFLIQEQRSGENLTNWRQISAGVPLTIFKQNGTRRIYNYSVFYKKEVINSSNIKTIMDDYNSTNGYILNNSVSVPSGYSLELISTTIPNQYLKFWNNPSSLILVDASNVNSAVIASLLAAYVNTPLIFINSSNKVDYLSSTPSNPQTNLILGKQIFIVTHGPISLDESTYESVENWASRVEQISDTSLQTEGSIYAFAKLSSTINLK